VHGKYLDRIINGDMVMKNTRRASFLGLLLIFIFMVPQVSNSPEKSTKTPYIIGSGNILEITTWKEPDFSRPEVLVRNDGMITFPLLNDIQAADRTTLELKTDIETRLKDYISNPVVTVTVRTPTVKKFYILGEVANTGEYDLVRDLTVLQAFALAGGFTEWASKKEIILLRNENGKEKIIRVNYKNIVKGKDFSQNIQLENNDTIIVP
jgi:polysaccharide export outer membrane protein